ncbi:MAG: hypothetical protein V1929_13805 [bacterium]
MNFFLLCMFMAVARGSAAGDGSRSSITFSLVAGENFISIPVRPDRDALADVFPSGSLPAGQADADSTIIFTYGGATDARPQAVYYRLSEDGHWMYSTGGIADAATLPIGEGFNIRLPAGAAAQKLVVTGRVPSGPVARELAGVAGATNYHVVGWPYPCPVRVRDLGLIEAGFEGGINVARSDEIRILNNANGQGSVQAPKARIWLNAKTSRCEFTVPRSGPAEDYVIEPGEAIIVVRKRAPALLWTMTSPCPPSPDAQ